MSRGNSGKDFIDRYHLALTGSGCPAGDPLHLEARVLDDLQWKLLHLDLIAAFVEEYRQALDAAAGDRSSAQENARRALKQVEKKISGILAAIEDGMYHPSMKAKMAELEAEKARHRALLDDMPEPPALRPHPFPTDLYRDKIAMLSKALQEPGMRLEASEILRSLISEIRLHPEPAAAGGHEIEVVGELAGILALSDADMPKPRRLVGLFLVLGRKRWMRGWDFRSSCLFIRPTGKIPNPFAT